MPAVRYCRPPERAIQVTWVPFGPRLEASRRPALRDLLTQRVREDVELNVANHLKAGLPGDEQSVLLLYLAVNWLIVERLTLPGAMSSDEATRLVDTAVDRFL